jgi:hypothetical protein
MPPLFLGLFLRATKAAAMWTWNHAALLLLTVGYLDLNLFAKENIEYLGHKANRHAVAIAQLQNFLRLNPRTQDYV